MAFDVTNLQAVASQYSKETATKAVAKAKTAKLLIDAGQVTTGVKGTARINKMDATVVFQDGSTCGRTPLGSTILSDKNITVKPIKTIENICSRALYDTYYASLLSVGSNPETEFGDSQFAQKVMDMKAAMVASQVEKLIWQGDTTLTGTNNMKWINGLIKQITGATHIALTPTGSDIIAQLQSVYTAMPIDVADSDDFRIFMGKDTFNAYVIAMAGKNIFRPVDDMTIFGTTGSIEVVPGLNGTGAVIATRLQDLHLGIDGVGDEEKAELRYSAETENWYLDFHFAVGVAAVYPEQIGYGLIGD